MEFLTSDDFAVPATSLNNELNVPMAILQGHLGKIDEDTWDMADRTPYRAMEYRINAGLGAPEVAPKAVSPAAAKRIVRAGANIQAKLIADKQRRFAAALGLSSGLGHIMSWTDRLLSDESGHNEKHAAGAWPDMSRYSTADIELVKRRQGLSQYEVEHMDPAILDSLIAKSRVSAQPVLPDAEPLQSPVEAAKESLAESIGGKAILASLSLSNLVGWLPWIGAGVAALYLAPSVIKIFKAARK